MALPNAALRWIDQFLEPRDCIARGQFGQTVIAGAENAGARRQARGRRLRRCAGEPLGEAPVTLGHGKTPLSFRIHNGSCTYATHRTPSARRRAAWLGQVSRICVSTSAFT